MQKRKNIIYWAATLWLSLGMISTGIVQTIQMKEELQKMNSLGYPGYFMSIIGIWKLLGVLVILLPKLHLLKEWAYAGFFFVMSGAIFSHLANSSELSEYFGPILLIILTFISWYFRPESRKS